MWICAKCIEREMEILGPYDTEEEVLDAMYDDVCNELGGEDEFYDLDNDGDANYDSQSKFAWANLHGINYDWKCFWI